MSIDEIQDCSEYQVFLRGEEFFKKALVREIHFHRSKNTVTSEVKDSIGKLFKDEELLYDPASMEGNRKAVP